MQHLPPPEAHVRRPELPLDLALGLDALEAGPHDKAGGTRHLDLRFPGVELERDVALHNCRCVAFRYPRRDRALDARVPPLDGACERVATCELVLATYEDVDLREGGLKVGGRSKGVRREI